MRPPVTVALSALLPALIIAVGLVLSRPGSPTAADNAIVLGATAAAPSASATLGGAELPDLVVISMAITMKTVPACLEEPSIPPLGVRVEIENAGDADAGSFVVEVNSTQQAVEAGLAAGESVSLWFGGFSGPQNTAFVDATSQVAESNEDNNLLEALLPVPTHPPLCSILTPMPPKLLGDANCDLTISALDAALVFQLGAGLLAAFSCGGNADVNKDSSVNVIDAALILQYVAGLLESLPPQ